MSTSACRYLNNGPTAKVNQYVAAVCQAGAQAGGYTILKSPGLEIKAYRCVRAALVPVVPILESTACTHKREQQTVYLTSTTAIEEVYITHVIQVCFRIPLYFSSRDILYRQFCIPDYFSSMLIAECTEPEDEYKLRAPNNLYRMAFLKQNSNRLQILVMILLHYFQSRYSLYMRETCCSSTVL